MNVRASLSVGRELKWVAPLVALLLLSSAANAADRLLIPEQMGLPFYTKGLGHTDDGTWVVTAFYRPLEWVPENGDLYALDFSIDPNCPLFVEGFAIFDQGAPVQLELRNVPGARLPICFAAGTDFLKAFNNGSVSLRELMRMDSLVIGWADFYHEILQPMDASGKAVSNVVASGLLEDGRRFYVHSEVIFLNGDVTDAHYNVTVRFGE